MPYIAEGNVSPALHLREKALLSLGELPAFTPILSKLLATLAGEDVSANTLGAIIEKDAVVAGNVLHLVNSALYARRGNIISVRHAISFLGMNKLRNAVLGMSVARLWKSVTLPAGWSRSRFNTHSAATAIMSDLFAQHVEVEDAETAFIAGLLHDIGHLLVAWSLPKQYAEIQVLNTAGMPWETCEREILGFTHAELSGDALQVWKLPANVIAAVRTHHAPPTGRLTMGLVVGSADRFVKSTGLSIHPLAASHPSAGSPLPVSPPPLSSSQVSPLQNLALATQPESKVDLSPLTDLGIDPGLAAALTTDFQTECEATLAFMS